MKTRDEAWLAKKYQWWWRDPKLRLISKDAYSHIRESFGVSAHAYELVRRGFPERKLPMLFELPPMARSLLRGAFKHGKDSICFIPLLDGESYPWPSKGFDHFAVGNKDQNWTEVMKDKAFTVPLRLNLSDYSDTTLMNAVREFIAVERRRKKIAAGNWNKRAKRAPSWRWLEIWDIHKGEGLPLNNSEHGQLSKASERAKELSTQVFRALESAKSFNS